jgi:hypothetical protein
MPADDFDLTEPEPTVDDFLVLDDPRFGLGTVARR